ncbi:MAG: sulfite exporter TauE/SafE family protein [Oscillospiraceae bacterium]|jgi:uncharacterized membrane protein YfcA|nr:sulfite exporter TauE/SafE family protein [Oscillospiraceae bacterium]
MEVKIPKIKYIITGILAGAANGLFGAGGGMFVVPLYARWAKLDEQKAFASSVAVILPICAVSAVVYLLRGGVQLRDALPYLLGGVAGGFLGGKLFKKIPTSVLRRAFALLLIYGGYRSVTAG